jgi:multidrug resistance efflux pump
VITNERQYRITKSEASKFAQAIAAAREREPSPDVDPRIHQAMIESLESELAVLREQLERYEALKAGKVTSRRARSLRELPIVLIEGRIAAGLTQRGPSSRSSATRRRSTQA